MTQRSLIFGSLTGISRKAYGELRDTVEARFDSVSWKEETLVIHSLRRHGSLKDVFGAMAGALSEGGGGSLLFVGNGQVVCFFFGAGRFAGRRYREPAPPSWWTPPSS